MCVLVFWQISFIFHLIKSGGVPCRLLTGQFYEGVYDIILVLMSTLNSTIGLSNRVVGLNEKSMIKITIDVSLKTYITCLEKSSQWATIV